jgi:hypothetical protein
LLLVAGVVAWALFLRRVHGTARRWVADPPGPPRQLPAPRPWERWLYWWPFLWVMLALVVGRLGLGLGIVLALAGRRGPSRFWVPFAYIVSGLVVGIVAVVPSHKGRSAAARGAGAGSQALAGLDLRLRRDRPLPRHRHRGAIIFSS